MRLRGREEMDEEKEEARWVPVGADGNGEGEDRREDSMQVTPFSCVVQLEGGNL